MGLVGGMRSDTCRVGHQTLEPLNGGRVAGDAFQKGFVKLVQCHAYEVGECVRAGSVSDGVFVSIIKTKRHRRLRFQLRKTLPQLASVTMHYSGVGFVVGGGGVVAMSAPDG